MTSLNKNNTKILFYWPVSEDLYPIPLISNQMIIFGPELNTKEYIYVKSKISVKPGPIDLEPILEIVSDLFEPDILLCWVMSDNHYIYNTSKFKGIKIFIPGDTHHMINPIGRLIDYSSKENYDILIILSSIQLIPKDHGWEKWYNFPHEREKILKLISDNKKLTIILSGDRHIGSMYKYNANLFEVTSSSFNQRIIKFIEEDKYSIGEIVNENNFGLMNINTSERLIEIDLRTGFLKENKIFKKLKLQF